MISPDNDRVGIDSNGLASFPLADTIFGRRSRRFGLGLSVPDGPWLTPLGMSHCRSPR